MKMAAQRCGVGLIKCGLSNSGDADTMESSRGYDRELDARGLNCPLPILRTKKALNEMLTGNVLKVLATDPASVKDFQAFSKQSLPIAGSTR